MCRYLKVSLLTKCTPCSNLCPCPSYVTHNCQYWNYAVHIVTNLKTIPICPLKHTLQSQPKCKFSIIVLLTMPWNIHLDVHCKFFQDKINIFTNFSRPLIGSYPHTPFVVATPTNDDLTTTRASCVQRAVLDPKAGIHSNTDPLK